MKIRRIFFLLALLIITLGTVVFRSSLPKPIVSIIHTIKGKKNVSDRVKQYGATVHSRLDPHFKQINIAYPPVAITLVAFKKERKLEVWVKGEKRRYKLLKTYPILGASGALGPKLKEGDGQVPEGIYKIESLNPNSLFHLALRVNYPNIYDKTKSKLEGRTNLGGDIMIHGNTCSIGCLAMGDQAAEDLFVLAAESGIKNISLILSPVDFRTQELPDQVRKVPPWTPELYASIKDELRELEANCN